MSDGRPQGTAAVRDRPRLVMVVDNQVVGDSRVAKSAMSAVQAGYETFVIGRAFSQSREESDLEGARLVRVPVKFERHAHVRDRPRRGLTRFLAFRDRADYEHARRMQQARVVDQKARILGLKHALSSSHGPRALLVKSRLNSSRLNLFTRTQLFRLRARQFRSALRRAAHPTGFIFDIRARVLRLLAPRWFWRTLHPLLLDYEIAYGPVIDQLAPDIIHAHDFRSIGIAVRAKWRAAAAGRSVGVIYDAHEHVPGLVRDKEFVLANDAHVAEYIRHADAVVTVSPKLAELLKRRYRLATLPRVVLNTPVANSQSSWPTPELRRRIDLADDVPLVVHSGSAARERGLDLVIRALPQIADLHFAIITGEPNALTQSYLDLAEEHGVADRVHLARYVAHEQVVDYLGSATMACIPMTTRTEKHHVAAPTKFYEYLHAKLPMVVSDTKVVADYVRRLGLGEVFRYDEPDGIIAAIRAILGDLEKYRASLAEADAARREYCWESQSQELVDTWQALNLSSLAPRVEPVERRSGLLVGRVNSGGQASAWVRALKATRPGLRADAVAIDRPEGLTHEADLRIPAEDFARRQWQLDFLDSAMALYSHILVEGLCPLLPELTETPDAELSLLERNGFRVGVVFHGSDIRDPELHEKLNPGSPFPLLRSAGQGEHLETLRDRARLRKSVVSWFGDPVFVSTPDLLDYVDRGWWLPVSIKLDKWTPLHPALERDRLVVLHVSSNEPFTGSDVIDRILVSLADGGLFKYLRVDDASDEEQMAKLIAAADIVVDQLYLGTYGVLACEAMAAGRLVVSEVGQRIRRRVPVNIPIVEVDAYSLEERLREIAGDPSAFQYIAAAGPQYVRQFHDGRYAGRLLARWLSVTSSEENALIAEEEVCRT